MLNETGLISFKYLCVLTMKMNMQQWLCSKGEKAMREILFKGKRIDNGEWVKGFLVKKIDPLLGVESWFILVQEYDTSCIDKKPTLLESLMTWYKVIPETVSEFTSLCDKNGKKIFEGDVVKNIDGAFLVCWDKEKCAFIMRFLEYPYETLYLEEMWEDSEIIGNIHDNPELLKGGAE